MEEDVGSRDGEDSFVEGEDGWVGERLDVLFAVSRCKNGGGSVTRRNVLMVARVYAS